MRVKVEYRSCSKECYKQFKLNNPNVQISYTDWANIIYTHNYAFRDYLLETGERVKLPWGFGYLAISKKVRKLKRVSKVTGKEIMNLPINWEKTRQKGKHVYHLNLHTEGFGFRWKWFPNSARFAHADIWYFKPSRVSSRLLTHYLKQPDYQHKYNEWDSL